MKRTCGGINAMSSSEKKARLALRFKSKRKRRKLKPREPNSYINQRSSQKLPYSKFPFSPPSCLDAEERIRSAITDSEADWGKQEHASVNLGLVAARRLSSEAGNEILSMGRERVEVEKLVDQPESQSSKTS